MPSDLQNSTADTPAVVANHVFRRASSFVRVFVATVAGAGAATATTLGATTATGAATATLGAATVTVTLGATTTLA